MDSIDGQKIDTGIGESTDATCTSIGKQPLFDADSFADYKRNARRRVEMHPSVTENRLLSTIGMGENGASEMAIYDYFTVTK